MVPKPPRIFVQRSTPATRHFPNLHRIQPGLQVRRGGIPKDPNDNERRKSLRTMYQDMGVLVYSGISTKQVNKIGDLLKEALKPALRLSTAPRHQGEEEFDKFAVYRLQTEEWHVDPFYRPKRGYIKVEGLLDLGLKAARQWANHLLEKAEEVESLRGSFGFTEADVNITFNSANRGGVIHHTVNGPRRLPVDAFVLAGGGNKFSMRVHLFTVGMRKHVGTINLNLVPINKLNHLHDVGKWGSRLQELFDLAPSDHVPDVELLRETMDGFYDLEREVWHKIFSENAQARARAKVEAKNKEKEEEMAKIEAEANAQVEKEEAESQSQKPEESEAQPEQNSAETTTKS
ncbi:hypothetical protein CEP53_003493 [Fusarium sp. AF-6]|nr:hypothetical protein CEP53_003493 [Fusarium sp. AF-6]